MAEWTAQQLRGWHNHKTSCDKKVQQSKKHIQNYESFVHQWLKQSKLLSQLIASAWLEGEKATQIREIFTSFSTGHDDSELRALLTGQKPDLWNKCIFDPDEIQIYRFEVSWETFDGKVIDNHQAVLDQKPPYFTIVLPFPPRPALSEFTVTLDQIQSWVNAPIQEDGNGLIENPFPPYPYIPTTCS
ncbi:MAG: hypothetical protein RH949_25950 [Coleofasciculus sp. A1-SPW-01]|uniref:hypothetical protein n=1 Tax=Coleofasciculus sp. A1-SPW-01 TaxID=3070819 RepID=UPI0032F4F8DE